MSRTRTAQRLRWALVLTGVVAVLLVAYTGYQALKAKDALVLVTGDFKKLSDQLTTGDSTGARATLAAAQRHATEAQDNTHGPGWWLTSRIPAVGPNVVAVRTVSTTADALAHDVLPGVLEATVTLSPEALRPEDGQIDVAAIESAAPGIVESDRLLQQQVAAVADLDPEGLAPQIAGPVRGMQSRMAQASALSDRAARAVQVLPSMLGSDGRRTYLLLFQNNAEVRATGGIPGAFAVVVADQGHISLGRQGDSATIGSFDTPPLPLTEEELAIYGPGLGAYPQDVTFTPDFPRSAELIRAMWNESNGVQVDGVMSVDPVALSYLLAGTGPVETGGGRQLTSDNAVQTLLSDVYADIEEPARQNVFFNAVAGNVFDAVASGQGDPQAVLGGLVRSAVERRLLVWSLDEDEQAMLAATKVGGALSEDTGTSPEPGIFLNDGSGSKMDYYLRYDASVTSERCQADRQYLTVEVKMRSVAPQEVAALPDYVAASVGGAPRGTIRTTVYAYAPPEGYVDGEQVDGRPVELSEHEHEGRNLVSTTLDLAPAEEHTLSFDVVSGAGQTGDPSLRITPGASRDNVTELGTTSCD